MGPSQIQMGDEPSFDIPWEYDYAGDPAGTEQVVREIQDQLYTDTLGGMAGNDDLGAMSSWYVWSALGGYPEMPGSATLALGSPMFTHIAIRLADGRTITENAPAAADDAPYVHNLSINGTSWPGAYLPAGVFTNGGTLTWSLGTAPDPTWGTGAGDAPPSSTQGLLAALGYLSSPDDVDAVVAPGDSTTLTFGVQSMSDTSQQIDWTAAGPSGAGIEVGPTTGTLDVQSEAKSTQSVVIQVPSSTADGQYPVTIALQTATGATLPDVVAEIDVTPQVP